MAATGSMNTRGQHTGTLTKCTQPKSSRSSWYFNKYQHHLHNVLSVWQFWLHSENDIRTMRTKLVLHMCFTHPSVGNTLLYTTLHLVSVYVLDTCVQRGQQELVLLKLMLQVGERQLGVTDTLQEEVHWIYTWTSLWVLLEHRLAVGNGMIPGLVYHDLPNQKNIQRLSVLLTSHQRKTMITIQWEVPIYLPNTCIVAWDYWQYM